MWTERYKNLESESGCGVPKPGQMVISFMLMDLYHGKTSDFPKSKNGHFP